MSLRLLLILALFAPVCAAAQQPRFIFELEGGPVWQTRNDVEIPNDGTATRFSLRSVTGSGAWPAGRLYATWNISDRHGVRLLLAPLSVTADGIIGKPLEFAGASYSPGSAEATYTFNSYRLSYRYRWRATTNFTGWAGVTAKIRDAEIALQQGATRSSSDNVGFVPLLHAAGEWHVGPRIRLVADVDALAGGPGRAVDAALKAGYDIGDRVTLSAGYRTVEGGADVESLYNFAWLHYAVVSLTLRR